MRYLLNAPVTISSERTTIDHAKRLMDGLTYNWDPESTLSEWICDSEFPELKTLTLSDTGIRFSFNPDDNHLYIETIYRTPTILSKQELIALKAYTLGQWSDGVGENFENDYYSQTGISIRPPLDEEKLIIMEFYD